jgi:hypothetical protein
MPPTIEEIIHNVQEARIFSKLDLNAAFERTESYIQKAGTSRHSAFTQAYTDINASTLASVLPLRSSTSYTGGYYAG